MFLKSIWWRLLGIEFSIAVTLILFVHLEAICLQQKQTSSVFVKSQVFLIVTWKYLHPIPLQLCLFCQPDETSLGTNTNQGANGILN